MEDNYFWQVICKYISAIVSSKIEALLVYKILQLISKVNVKILKKFDTIFITKYWRYCAPLLISILHIYNSKDIVDDNQRLFSNNKKDRFELEDTLSQKISKNYQVT